MFDFSISELLVIAVVALVVIGPEKLPRVARGAGILLGRVQRYVSNVKSDIEREIQLEELKKMQIEVEKSVMKTGKSIEHSLTELDSDVQRSIAGSLKMNDANAPIESPQAEDKMLTTASAANSENKESNSTTSTPRLELPK